MPKRIVVKRSASGGPAAQPERRTPTPPRAAPRRSGSGSPLKWLFLVAFLVGAVVFVSYAAQQRKQRRLRPTRVSRQRTAYDPITASMGGKSMKEWCAEQDRTNKALKERRSRMRGNRATR